MSSEICLNLTRDPGAWGRLSSSLFCSFLCFSDKPSSLSLILHRVGENFPREGLERAGFGGLSTI